MKGKCHACTIATTVSTTTTPTARGEGGGGRARQYNPEETGLPLQSQKPNTRAGNIPGDKNRSFLGTTVGEMITPKEIVGGRDPGVRDRTVGGGAEVIVPPAEERVLGDPQKSFEYFRNKHPGTAALEENKTLLGEKYARAKVSLSNLVCIYLQGWLVLC